MNYHLDNSTTYQTLKSGAPVTNFSKDIKDSIAYACLLEQIQPRDEETNEYELMPAITAETNVSSGFYCACIAKAYIILTVHDGCLKI